MEVLISYSGESIEIESLIVKARIHCETFLSEHFMKHEIFS